ncbi:hypothetical protein A6R68_03196 [Neotoma lepida]|uniref:Uncharacterized protein n=1 Tax=Neotoma lepida TaxID=56216 RepID=A0A1A6GSD6_NEOLE|nr:hypothetical protein A6R68_03196 [Neotoma lepida]
MPTVNSRRLFQKETNTHWLPGIPDGKLTYPNIQTTKFIKEKAVEGPQERKEAGTYGQGRRLQSFSDISAVRRLICKFIKEKAVEGPQERKEAGTYGQGRRLQSFSDISAVRRLICKASERERYFKCMLCTSK